MTRHVLILGGTAEARELAQLLAPRADLRMTLSLAGRTAAPLAQAVPVRRGGFGGVAGLAQFLRDQQIAALIDATHPYAAQISRHARESARQSATPWVRLCRSPWQPEPGDQWTEVTDAKEAVSALGVGPRNVFLTLGRQEISRFEAAPQHRYLIRSVDPVERPLNVPSARYILDRGPFAEENERALLLEHAIDVLVAKNSGGPATYGKIKAARSLCIPVIMLRRPPESNEGSVGSIADVVAWLDHALAAEIERGV